GRVDEKTGKIIPKKNRAAGTNFLDDAALRSRRFGGSYALVRMAEGIGLRDDLYDAFGADGDRLLAAAVAQVLAGGPLSSVEDAADGCLVREILGIGGRFGSPRMTEFTQRLGEAYDGMETLFGKRLARAGSVLSYDITSVSTYGHMRGWAEWGHNRDEEAMRQANIGLVTDKEGVPAMFEMYPGSVSDMATLERTVERVLALGAGTCTLVMDRGFGSAANLQFMIDAGMPFVIPGKQGTKCVKGLMSSLIRERDDQERVRIHDGVVYAVIEADVAIVPRRRRGEEGEDSNDTAELEMVLEDDVRFAAVPAERRLTAFACYDAGKAAEDRRRLQLALADIEKRLRSMDPWAAVRDQRKVAGPYAKYLECKVEDGALVIERKRNALSFAVNREGMFVMFSHGLKDWEAMMSCYDCRTYVEQAFDALKNELDGNRWRTGDPTAARGRLFVKFVSLILWCEASRLLRSERDRTPVSAAIQSLDNIMAVGIGETWRITEVTRKNRERLKAFGLPEPVKRYTLKEHDFIPQRYLQ
ncbi:MAG TPA: IS1634 family transposase, partial [Methanomassiliicoccales archaeon]|nr:IS1634 family transposase [Methanomassiliicoccales archaeon]